MLLLCVAFALLTVGFVVPCVIDVATTPGHLFDLPSKSMWVFVTAAFWVFGAAVWLLIGRREVQLRRHWDDMTGSWMTSDGSRPRRPARRPVAADYPFGSRRSRRAALAVTRFIAPDDNPEFLLELDRRIRDWREDA
jgi:hypothetical protein